jgi:hypothetical protein
MTSDTEIKLKGIKSLNRDLGSVEAERFISLIQREAFDYTEWQKTLCEGMSIKDISAAARQQLQNSLPNLYSLNVK